MYTRSNLVAAVANVNNSGAMRVDTILKMGRSSKSQMSRGNFFISKVLMSLVMLAIIGTSAVFAQQPTLDKLKIRI